MQCPVSRTFDPLHGFRVMDKHKHSSEMGKRFPNLRSQLRVMVLIPLLIFAIIQKCKSTNFWDIQKMLTTIFASLSSEMWTHGGDWVWVLLHIRPTFWSALISAISEELENVVCGKSTLRDNRLSLMGQRSAIAYFRWSRTQTWESATHAPLAPGRLVCLTQWSGWVSWSAFTTSKNQVIQWDCSTSRLSREHVCFCHPWVA